MSSATPVDAVLATGSRVGRYFSIVSLLPSVIFIVYVAWLLYGGAAGPQFDPRSGARGLASLGLGDWVLISVAAFALAVVLHPLTFPFTQLLEGYWGSSRLALALTTWRIKSHSARADSLERRREAARDAWIRHAYRSLPARERASFRGRAKSGSREDLARQLLNLPDTRRFLRHYIEEQGSARSLNAYPTQRRRTMPTRLGNAWRRHEDSTGRQYGLSTVTIAPHLSLVADKEHYAYARDQGDQVDLAIRVTLLGLLATAITVVLLANDGPWAGLAFVPFAASYLAYLGAVSAVGSYSAALATVLDLNRFRLYDSLRLPLPNNSVEEPERGEQLCALIEGEDVGLVYRSSEDPPSSLKRAWVSLVRHGKP